MAITAKLLAEGLCPASATAVYTVPGATTALVKSINIHNDNATAETIYIYVNGSGTNRPLVRVVLLSEETLVYNDPLVLQTGDTLLLSATTATGVSYAVSGAEVT